MANADALQKTFFGHPRGLATLFFTEMWERFSYYGMRALLVLFMVDSIQNGGFGWAEKDANGIYGLYLAFVYLMALPGGWIADRFIGQRKAVWYGGIIIAAGHFSMAVPNKVFFFIGLVLIVLGTGLLKPNVSTIVGDLYPEGGARRDAGFSVFYTGINLGAFLGPLVCSFLGENVNWHYGFSAAGVGMVFGLIQFRMTEKYLGEAGVEPKANQGKPPVSNGSSKKGAMGLAILLLLAIGYFTAHKMGILDLATITGIVDATGILILTVAIAYFTYQFTAGGFDADQKKRLGLIAILFLGAAIFWSGFEQAGSSLNLFAKYFTDRNVFGWSMPAGFLQSVNPIFIIVLAPFFGSLWIMLAKKNLEPSVPLKFAVGLIFLGLGFLVMFFAAKLAITSKVGPTWLVLTYLLHTTGELCLSPVGLSAMTKLAPRRIAGQIMGIWFLATSLGNLIAGRVAGQFDFSSFDKADKALGAVEGAKAFSTKLFENIDPSILEKMKEVDPNIMQSTNLDAIKAVMSQVIDKISAESVQVMPDQFWIIVITTVGAGLIFLVLAPFIRKLTGGRE